jgi:hypothetical protein
MGVFRFDSETFTDVVPVETRTVDEWQFPPFSGHFDGISFPRATINGG